MDTTTKDGEDAIWDGLYLRYKLKDLQLEVGVDVAAVAMFVVASCCDVCCCRSHHPSSCSCFCGVRFPKRLISLRAPRCTAGPCP